MESKKVFLWLRWVEPVKTVQETQKHLKKPKSICTVMKDSKEVFWINTFETCCKGKPSINVEKNENAAFKL